MHVRFRRSIVTLTCLVLFSSGIVVAQSRTVRADLAQTVGPHTQVPLRVVGAGRANKELRADWQEQLSMLQREIGFKYIRMHGILHDDMGVYREDAQGNAEYNFQALLKRHIRPFVELTGDHRACELDEHSDQCGDYLERCGVQRKSDSGISKTFRRKIAACSGR